MPLFDLWRDLRIQTGSDFKTHGLIFMLCKNGLSAIRAAGRNKGYSACLKLLIAIMLFRKMSKVGMGLEVFSMRRTLYIFQIHI